MDFRLPKLVSCVWRKSALPPISLRLPKLVSGVQLKSAAPPINSNLPKLVSCEKLKQAFLPIFCKLPKFVTSVWFPQKRFPPIDCRLPKSVSFEWQKSAFPLIDLIFLNNLFSSMPISLYFILFDGCLYSDMVKNPFLSVTASIPKYLKIFLASFCSIAFFNVVFIFRNSLAFFSSFLAS